MRALVLGAARQGLSLARFMAGQGAEIIVTDGKPYEALTDAREALKDIPVEWACGGHPLELLDRCDVVCVTAGADPRIPILAEARRRGIPIENDASLFLKRFTSQVIAITGSSGKTTTTTIVGRMARAFAEGTGRKVFVGGNIGLPLLSFIDEIGPDDIVILELSSFQLEMVKNSPHIGAILNITPNHLDRHETMENYTRAKMNILSHQGNTDIAVLFRENEAAWDLRNEIRGHLIDFGFEKPEVLKSDASLYLDGSEIKVWTKAGEQVLMTTDLIRLRGRHNVCNVIGACALAYAAGFTPEAMQAGVRDFSGVEHRLQWVRNYHGADWYNDSIATAPERTLAAVHSFTEPLIMLLGGRDKHLPWDELAEELQSRARCCVLFGEAGPMIREYLEKAAKPGGPELISCEALEDAVRMAADRCQPGDVVLLSPGGTGYDAFLNFEERGKKFTEWVLKLR